MAVKKKAKKSAARGKARPKRTASKRTAKKAPKQARKTTAPKKAGRKASRATVANAGRRAPAGRRSVSRAGSGASSLRKRQDTLRTILLRKRNEVVQGLETQMGRKLVFDASQKIDSAMDSADQSAQDVDQGIDYSLLEMKYGQYKDIADAFRKLQNNTYGLCEECGEEIPIKRMEVNPLARYCITCKTRKEELEKVQREENRFKE